MGTTWVASKPGGLNVSNDDAREIGAPHEVVLKRSCYGSRPIRPLVGKADVVREETATCTSRATAVRVQASRERLAEITSGRAIIQQGLAATCKDLAYEGQPAARGGRWSGAWVRMSEEREVTLPEAARVLPWRR